MMCTFNVFPQVKKRGFRVVRFTQLGAMTSTAIVSGRFRSIEAANLPVAAAKLIADNEHDALTVRNSETQEFRWLRHITDGFGRYV